MAVAQGPFLAAVLLLASLELHCYSPCPESCTCQRAPLLNCSSSGLSSVPRHIQDSVTELDLSHNLLDSVTLDQPHHNLRNVWLGHNSITHLSLCIERNLGSHYARGRRLHRLRPWGRQVCVLWAPTLHLLSVERNQLEQLPEGLEGSESLQVLQLSFNKISTLQPGDFSHLRQLKELHLQHNLITSLHPQMFQDLAQLKVLDLSFNMLTSLHPVMYLSLRNMGADVGLGGNRWQCDCSMRSLKRRMAYDSSRGLQAWSLVCASPSILSGKDLLQLEEDDLNCFSTENRPELHQDVTVYSGSEILLSCSIQDSMWWTPSGQASVSQPTAGLLINDITERDTGLYVCVSEEHKVVSVFNLQISKIGGPRRKARSLPRTSQHIIPQGNPNGMGQERNQGATQSNLALAVCLSVFITFLIAFILGVLARPCIDVLWRRVTNKKSSSATNSVSSAEQRQYDNEAYFNSEEPEEIGTHRERRVTFSTIDYREDSNVQYYDTVANGDQESINNDAVIECEAAEAEKNAHKAGDSGSENSLQQRSPDDYQKDGRDLSGVTDAGRTHNKEFERIPDPVELKKRRSSSSCSDYSVSDKVFNEDQMTQGDYTTPKSPQLAEDSVQQRADFSTAGTVEVSQISIEGRSEIPGYCSEPFADWSPHTNNTNLKDPDLWQESEEQFEFSDSVRSGSARSSSVCGSFHDSKLIVAPPSDKQRRDDMSSSSSYVSEDEPTQYTVNSDQEEEEDIERNHNKPEVTSACLKQDARFEQQIHGVDPIRPSVGFHLGHVTPIKRCLDIKAPSLTTDSSSSSDSEDETINHVEKQRPGKVDIAGLPFQESETESHDTRWPALDLQCIPPIKRRLDIKAPSPPPDSSSNSDIVEDKIAQIKKHEQGELHVSRLPFQESQAGSHDPDTRWPALDLEHIPCIKRRLDIKAPSPPPDSSSSSDSEDETTDHVEKQRPEKVDIGELSFQKSQTESNDPETRWPVLDLEHSMRIKKRLDIKAPSPDSDSSSSSDSEDETTGHIEKQRPGKVDIAQLPFQESRPVSHDPDTRWPALDLEHIPRIKRHLDIKAPSPPPDSSSGSDSEDETTNHRNKQEKRETHIARLPIKVPQPENHDPKIQWPTLDLEHTISIKRRLDIKAPSPDSDSSSSSDNEDETTNHVQKQRPEKVDIGELSFQKSQTESNDPETRWPVLDLEHSMRIKKRLDIKAPSPDSDSSSSSDSEYETTGHIEKQRPGKVDIAQLPFQESRPVSHDPDTRWPALDLEHIPRIKRHLDIKAPSPPPDSSSGSDSEDETTNHRNKQEKRETHIARLPIKVPQPENHDPKIQWPTLDLEHTISIKRRLDIKAPSPSSSDNEDETTNHVEKQTPEKVDIGELSFQKSQTESNDPDTRWPVLDVEQIPRIKRRLDIKAPSPASESSSSSDSEDEPTHHTKKERPGAVGISGLPFQESQTVSHDPETRWPAVDSGNIARIKRRLDLKAPSLPPDSRGGSMYHIVGGKREEAIKISPCYSSSSSDEQEEGMEDLSNPPTTQEPDPDSDSRWPELGLSSAPRVKRCLDIKASLSPPDSSSSSDESEGKTTDLPVKMERDRTDVGITSYQPGTKLPDLNMSVFPVKRRLNIKAPSQPADFLSFNSDNESTLSSHTVIHERDKGDTGITNHDQQTKLHQLGVPYINRRLDIKAPSPQPDPVLSSVYPGSRQSESNSFSSDSEDENRDHTKLGLGVSAISKATEKEFIRSPKTPVINISHSPKTDHNIKLEKYTIFPDDMGNKTTSDNISTTPEINPELESRWATMNLSISRFRKRLEITPHTHEPPNLPSSLLPGSPSSTSNESGTGSKSSRTRPKRRGVGMQGIIHTESSPTPENKPVNVSLSLKGQDDNSGNTVEVKERLRKDYSLPTTGQKSNTMLRGLGEASSSSNSENETKDRSVPDLSLGVPRIKRRLNVMAPLPEPHNSLSSCSESENESNMSGLTDDDSLITYKRLIMKDSSLPSNSSSPSGQTIHHTNQRHTGAEMVTVAREGQSHSMGDRNASLSPRRVPSMSFDDVVKKRIEQSRCTTDVDLPPEIRWTGVGCQLPDLSISSPRRHLDVGSSFPQQATPAEPELPPPDSSNSSSNKSGDKIKQDREEADVTLTHKYSSLSSNNISFTSSRALYKFDNSPSSTNEIVRAVSEDGMDRKGLSALKAMSSERRKWDTENLDEGASPLCDDHGLKGDTIFNYRRSEEDIKPLAKQPQSHISPTSVNKRRATDLLYGIPRYRRDDIGEPLQEAPPPIPATPPPDEAVGLTWGSPRSSKKQGLEGIRSYLQQSRQTEESDPSSLTSQNLAVYFDSSNINTSDV